jgi:hypothetical protein
MRKGTTMTFYKLMNRDGWQTKIGYDGKQTHLYAVLVDKDQYGVVGADGYIFESIFLSNRGDGSYIIPATRVPSAVRIAWDAAAAYEERARE